LSVCLSFSKYLAICLSLFISLFLSLSLSLYLSIYICLSVYLSLSIYLESVCLFVYLSSYRLSVCPSVGADLQASLSHSQQGVIIRVHTHPSTCAVCLRGEVVIKSRGVGRCDGEPLLRDSSADGGVEPRPAEVLRAMNQSIRSLQFITAYFLPRRGTMRRVLVLAN